MLKLAGVIDTVVTSPARTASTPVSCGRIWYLPRPMNSPRTFWVNRVSRLKTVVRLMNVGTPMVLDVRGEKRAATGEGVAAACGCQRKNDAEDTAPGSTAGPSSTSVSLVSSLVDLVIAPRR